jgi:MFS family permease
MFHGTRALRHRNYRLFFGGQAVSLIGTWMQQVAQGWLVLQLTHDPFMLGLIAVAQFGPVVIFGLFGGFVADQLPKRRTLIWTQAASMVLAFAMFGLTASGVVEVWHIIVLAVLLGFVNTVDMPTRQAFAVEMVGRDDMTNAVGLNSALFNGSRIVGPAIAGLLIGWFDISIAFLINGISFLAVIGAYQLMRDEELRAPPKVARPTSWKGVLDNLAEGVSYVRRTPLVLLAVTVVGLGATFGMNFSVLAPPLADQVLNVGATGFGFLMAATGIGSTAAALGVAFSRRPRPRQIVVGTMLLGLGSLVLAWSTSFPVSLLAMAIVGAGGMGMAVTANTTIQLAVPDQLRGRVMSVYTTVFSGSVPAGGLLMGALASRWDVPLAFAVGGMLTLAVGVGAWYWLRQLEARGEARLPSRKVVPGPAVGADAPSFPSARPR